MIAYTETHVYLFAVCVRARVRACVVCLCLGMQDPDRQKGQTQSRACAVRGAARDACCPQVEVRGCSPRRTPGSAGCACRHTPVAVLFVEIPQLLAARKRSRAIGPARIEAEDGLGGRIHVRNRRQRIVQPLARAHHPWVSAKVAQPATPR
jgi:hypothetical protein